VFPDRMERYFSTELFRSDKSEGLSDVKEGHHDT